MSRDAPRFLVTLTSAEARAFGLPPGLYPAQLAGVMAVSPDASRLTLTLRVWAPGVSGELESLGPLDRTYLAT